jgi:hypothetical protein
MDLLFFLPETTSSKYWSEILFQLTVDSTYLFNVGSEIFQSVNIKEGVHVELSSRYQVLVDCTK